MTITADFSGGEKTVTTEPLYQWDTGQKLALSGLPQTASDIQVHFANAAMAQAIVKATELVDSLPTCDIPNEFLQFGSAAKARAWVFYKASNTEGYTVRAALIPITPRKRPNDYVSPEDPDSKGIVDHAIELLENYQSDLNAKEEKSNKKTTLTGNELSNDFYPTTKAVADALRTKAPLSTAYTFDTTTTNVVYNTANPKTIYLNATVDGEDGIVITAKDNGFQIFFGRNSTTKIRHFSGGTSYSNWAQVTEHVDNKKNSITNANRTSTDYYPSIKAVVDYLATNYENLSNKKTTLTGNESRNEFYPSIKAVVDYLTANYIGNGNNTVSWDNLAVAVQTLISGKEDTSNKLTSEEGIDSNSTDTEYPSAKAVYDLGVEILALVNDDISNVESRLVLKESFSNKKNAIAGNETSEQYYPTTKAVYDYGSQISSAVEDVKAYLGYTSSDILGLHADFENKQFTRLGAAVGLNAGSDFDAFPMYGQRRRVVVESDGTITQAPPERITSGNISYDIMVYQPKFYYKVVPLKLEKQSSGLGYHIRKANYYISSTPHAGFKLHPLFFDKNGNEIEYVLFSAYEASYLYPTEGGFDYFHDGAGSDTGTSLDLEYGVLKSMPNVKPISGQYKAFNKTNAEILAQNKSSNWHLDTIQSVSANQLLMAIEYGSFNTQSAIGLGIVSNTTVDTNNCSSLTGSTSAETFNTASGMANETIYDVAGTETPFNTNGKLAVSYRGTENPWGNIWKHINGINLWGNGSMGGGQVYIADNFNFNEEVKGETTINNVHYKYSSAGFSVANASGWISAFGYGKEEYDWLFLPSETTGNSSLPVNDFAYVAPDLNGYKIFKLGSAWTTGDSAGFFDWYGLDAAGTSSYASGGRLLYVPTATV